MGDQTQSYDIFQTPLSSGYPLPLKPLLKFIEKWSQYIMHMRIFSFAQQVDLDI